MSNAMSVSKVLFTVVYFYCVTIGVGFGDLFENDVCCIRESKPWTCQKADLCPHLADDLEKEIRPFMCGFDGSEPIVCCNMRPSEGWCRYYRNSICGEIGVVVIGGEQALSKEFPHMALIGYGSKKDISWQCGGSLISDQFVLSAAHCAEPSPQIGPARWVRLGELDISNNTDDADPEDFSIIERIVHPQYDPVYLYNDIALFKLDRKVKFNDYKRPACLHQTAEIEDETAIVTGWGRIDFVGPTSAFLMKADVSIFSNEDCKKFTGNNSQLPSGIDPETQFCAGEIDGARDTCQGDSGGPLTRTYGGNCMAKQLGVTSFGKQCGLPEAPGVYTRVSQYLSWIEPIVWPLNYIP